MGDFYLTIDNNIDSKYFTSTKHFNTGGTICLPVQLNPFDVYEAVARIYTLRTTPFS